MTARPSDQAMPSRRARFPAAALPAPGDASSSRHASGAGHSVLTVALPDSALMLLRLIGAHDGVEDEGAIVSRLVAARAEEIGIAALADAGEESCAGRAAVARPDPARLRRRGKSHKPEVASSTLAPAISIHPESEEGREGVPSGAFPLPQGPP